MSNQYLEKIASWTEEEVLEKAAAGGAWGAVGGVIKSIGNKLGASPGPRRGFVGPSAAPTIGNKVGGAVRQFGKNVVSGKGNARLGLAAAGGVTAGLAAGKMMGSNDKK